MLITGETEGWYSEFGTVADLAKAYRRPFVHDGQYSTFRKRRFGAPADDRPPEQFIVFDQNHDQVGNRAFGDRLTGEARALGAFCTLLSPFTPMVFMGEEYGEPAPFQFFSDHIDEQIATATREGRRREFADAYAKHEGEEVPDPQDPATFERSKLTRERDPRIAALYADLLRVRAQLPRTDVVATPPRRGRPLADRRPRAVSASRVNFADGPREVPLDGQSEIVLATGSAEPHAGHVLLASMTGALLR